MTDSQSTGAQRRFSYSGSGRRPPSQRAAWQSRELLVYMHHVVCGWLAWPGSRARTLKAAKKLGDRAAGAARIGRENGATADAAQTRAPPRPPAGRRGVPRLIRSGCTESNNGTQGGSRCDAGAYVWGTKYERGPAGCHPPPNLRCPPAGPQPRPRGRGLGRGYSPPQPRPQPRSSQGAPRRPNPPYPRWRKAGC